MYNFCITPGCMNKPRNDTAHLCHSCKARSDAAKQERERERKRNKPRSGAICVVEGCGNVHHGRSRYCLEHVKQPRGSNVNQPRAGTLRLARHLLRVDDLPQRVRKPELVRLWNIKTG